MKFGLLIFISFIFLTLVNLQIYFDVPPAPDGLILAGWMNNGQGTTLANNMVLAQEDDKKFISGFNTGSYPVGITINPFTNKIYVANQYSNTVSVFDAKTDKLISTIQTGIFPYSIDANQFNNRIYVTNRGSNDVTVIDGSTDSVIDNITVGKSPVQVASGPIK